MMNSIDFIFEYYEDEEKFLLEQILEHIKNDVNKAGGIASIPFNYHLVCVDDFPVNYESLLKEYPNACFVSGKAMSGESENFFNDRFAIFFSDARNSKKLHKNIISLHNYLCSDELAIQHLLTKAHKTHKIWFFVNESEYKNSGEPIPEDGFDVFDSIENEDLCVNTEVIKYQKELIKYAEKKSDLPASVKKIVETISKEDIVIFDAIHSSGDMLSALLMGELAAKKQQQKIVLINDDPEINFLDIVISIIGLDALNHIELISFSNNNDDLYLRMEEFIEKLDFNWNDYNSNFEFPVNSITRQKNLINDTYIAKGLEIIYLVKKAADIHKIKFTNRNSFIDAIMWSVNRFDGINDKYIGLSANYSFIGGVNIEPSHYTYRTVPSSKDSAEFISLLTSSMSNVEESERTVAQIRKDEEALNQIQLFESLNENDYFKLFHNVQLKTKVDPRALKNIFDNFSEKIETEFDEVFDGFGTKIEECYSENFYTADINYVYFDILNISRISIEDQNWSVEFHLDLISRHDEGLEVIKFDNLSKKDALFEHSLISKEKDVENEELINFRYRISANFDFDAVPMNYPFDQQYLSISYSSTNTEKYGSIHPVPVRKIDNSFSIEGWEFVASNAGISRTVDKKSVGSNLSQNASVKEVAKIGWKVQRGNSMTLFKILLPLSFLLALTYYSIFVPLNELGDSISILSTVFLASIALYFSTERPQPLSMTIVDLIFASFYTITGITMVVAIIAKLYNPIAFYLLFPLKILLPISFIALGAYIYKRIKSNKFSPTLISK